MEMTPKINLGDLVHRDPTRHGGTLKPLEFESRTPISTRHREQKPTVNSVRVRFLKSKLVNGRIYSPGDVAEIPDYAVNSEKSDRANRRGLLELGCVEVIGEAWQPPVQEPPEDLSDDGPKIRIKTIQDVPSLVVKKGVTMKVAERVACLMELDGVCDILDPVSKRGEKFRRKLATNPSSEY
jgi:hypothetical protein